MAATDLFAVLLLDPGSNVQAPRNRHQKSSNDVLRVDGGDSQLVEDIRFMNTVRSNNKGNKGEGTENAGGNLGANAEH